jgi:tape measure domain-containing protein
MADNKLEIKIVADSRQAVSAIGEQAKAFGALAQNVEVAQISLRKMAVAVAAGQAALAGIVNAVKTVFLDAPRSLLEGAVAAEKMQKAFLALEGSADAAGSQIAFVRDEAQRLGVPLAEASEAWLKLAAAARGTALEGEGARRIFSAVAGAASTLGLSASETSGALLAISQMMSKGTVQAEELRGQLGERVPGAFQIAARAMGVSTRALGEMLDRGEVLAEDFLPKFAAQLAKEIPASADGVQNAINRISNAAEEWKRVTGSALAVAIDGFFGLKQSAGELGKDGAVIEWARLSAKAIAVLVDVVREMALFVPNVLRTIGGSVAAVARDIKLAFDIAAAAATEGVGERGRAAMRQALQERNAFVAQFNEDMAQRWMPKQISQRVDEFFDDLAKRQSSGAAKAGAYLDAELTKEQQKTIDAIKSKEEKLAAEYKAHANNLYAALTSGALDIEQYNAQRAKLEAWYSEQLQKVSGASRMPRIISAFDTELAALQSSLKTAEGVLEASFRARLLGEENYWQAKGQMQRRELDLQAQELQRAMEDQQRMIDALSRMRPKDENQRQDIADRIQQAKNRIAELQVKMGEIDGRRMVVDLEVNSNLQRVRQELDDIKASLREQLAEATGEMTPEMRRAAIERAWRETLRRLEGDAEGTALARRLIDVQAAKAELDALQQQWQLAAARMRDEEQSINVQRAQGLITTAQAQERIAQAHRQAAAEMDALLPKMQAVADVLGPQAQQRVREFRTEMQSVAAVIDPIAASLQTSVKQGFEDMFVSMAQGAKTAKDAFMDFARSVLAAIQRILAQRLAEQLFAGMSAGSGGWFASFAKWLGFADGGYVTGPGTSTSDSIPARLSAGEYVIRAEAVRRFGVAFLDAINGLRLPPTWNAGRLAFATGGMVPMAAAQPAQQQAIRIVNSIDPAVTHDHLQTPAGERLIVNIIGRNAGQVRAALQG